MAFYRNQRDVTGECSAHGHAAETVFRELLKAEGYTVTDATMEEQRNHVDFIATRNNSNTRFDVKARKKISRQDNNYQDEFVWVEILNVRGDKGWVFGGADFIAFEREKDFLIVRRDKLADFIQKTCNLRKQAFHPSEALYCRYQRRGRQDCVTLITAEDLVKLTERTILKNVI